MFNALFGLSLAGLYLYTIDLDENNQFLNLYSLLFFVFCIALPPTFFLYVKSLTQSMAVKESLSDSAKHLYPALLLLVINLFAFVFLNIRDEESDFFSYVQNVMEYANLIAIFFILLFQVILYLFLSAVSYRNYSKSYENLYSYKEGVSLNWLLSFIIGFFVFIVLIYLVQIGIPYGGLIFGVSMLIYVVFINYNALNQERVYSELYPEGTQSISNHQEKENSESHELGILSISNDPLNQENENSGLIELTPESAKGNESNERDTLNKVDNNIEENRQSNWLPILVDKLEDAMNVDKLYKDTSLNLFQLSNHLESNTKYLSYAINNHYEKNFSSYINEYRIKEAIILLSDKDHEQYTLEHISNMSGFKSRSAFISSFKKIKKMTPSQFKKSLPTG